MSDRRYFRHREQAPRPLTGRHVLVILLGFFGVVFAVNGVFLGAALSTYTGVVSQDTYVKGLQYNATIAADERQGRRGWAETVSIGRDGRIELDLHRPDGAPVQGLVVSATIGRPSTNRLDQRLQLIEAAPGHYVGKAGRLEAGTWLVSAEALEHGSNAEPVYRTRSRRWLKP